MISLSRRAMAKIGTISLVAIAILILLCFLLIPIFSSASEEKQNYVLGEKVKIDLEGGWKMKIITPTNPYIKKGKGNIIFIPEEIGNYKLEIFYKDETEVYEFEVIDSEISSFELDDGDEFEEENFGVGAVIDEEDSGKENREEGYEEDSQIRVGKPVKWVKKINKKIKIPDSAENISVYSEGKEIEFEVKRSLVNKVAGVFGKSDKEVVIEETVEGKEAELVYYTKGPEKREKIISNRKKEVTVYSNEHYENVIAFTEISEIVSYKEDIKEDNIIVYWKNEEKQVDFIAKDEDSDGKIDYVEWEVPHLSEQVFEIIVITEAEHLDSDKEFIKKVYDEVKEKDGLWLDSISDGEYLRVKFEEHLINGNDITVYAKGSGKIEIYPFNKEKIGEINIGGEKEYKFYLNKLLESEDIFDLKIIGDLEIDYIVDPTTTQSPSAFIDVGGDWVDDTYAYDNDGDYAEATTYKTAEIIYYNFSFPIPPGSTVNSVRVRTDYYVQDIDDYFELEVSWDGGTSWTATPHVFPNAQSETTNWTNVTIDTIWYYGNLSNSNFRVRYDPKKTGAAGSYWRIEYVAVEVMYTEPISALAVKLNTSDIFNSTIRFINFTYTPTTDNSFVNCSLWDNSTGSFSYNKTNETVIVNGSLNSINKTYTSDGTFLWNIKCCDNNNCTFALLNRTILIDTIYPTVSLIEPLTDNFTDSNEGVNFTYNVTDNYNIANCSLVVDNEKVVTDTSVTRGATHDFEYFLSDGLHNWSINCTDWVGNENYSETRIINVSVPPADWGRRWYETFTSNYTSTAYISLENSRDSTENNVSMPVGADNYVTVVDAKSPYMGGYGAFITSGTVSFSGVFSTTKQNQEYITWKVYISNSSGDTLICQSGDDDSGGTRITATGISTYTSSCNNPSNLNLQNTDRIRLVVNAFNDFGSTETVVHYWDTTARLSYVEFTDFYSLGSLYVNMTSPTTNQNILTSEELNMTCNVTCIGGRCLNTNVYVQYNTSALGWTNIGASGNLILAGGETNPHSMGSVNSTSQQTIFTIQGNVASVNNIRCIAESDYSDYNGTTTKQVTVSSANQAPDVNLTTPSPDYWFNYSNPIVLYYNVSDDNDQIANCSLYINGQFNQTNQTAVINNAENNFTLNNLQDAEYNWSVNCTDQSSLEGSDGQRTFYVDTLYPQIELVYPGIDDIVFQADVNFNFTVSDNLDDPITCNLTVDGDVIDPEFDASNGTYTNRSNSLGIADHLWNVTCWDEAGHVNTSETRNFTIQDLPPDVNLTTPSPDYWFNYSNPINLYYNVSDNNDLQNCTLYVNGQLNQSNQTVVINNAENNFTLNNLQDGTYNWTVNCTDTQGLSDQPAVRIFYVDTIFPQINLNLPGDTNVSLSADVNFNFTAIDNLDDPMTCNLTVDGGVVDSNFNADNNSLTNRLINSLTDGEKYWNVTCWDEAGNTNTSETWMINISEPPSTVLNTPPDTWFNKSDITLSYTPTDNTDLANCSLYINGIYNQSNQTSITNGAQNNFTLNVSSGFYNWSVTCEDLIGLTNSTGNRTFTIDLAKPSIFLNYPGDGDSVYSSVVNFNYTVSDDLDNNIECNLTVNSVLENWTYAQNNNNTIIPIALAQGGIKYWNVSCIDDAGNWNISETYNFTLYLPPDVNLTSPALDYWFNISNVTLYYNVSDGNNDMVNATVVLNGQLNESNSTPVLNNQENNISVNNLPDGQYNWTVNVSDAESLVGTDTERTFYIDTQMPNISITYPQQEDVVTNNNISFNFTVYDNLDNNLTCNLTIGDPGDPPVGGYENFGVDNATPEVNYIIRGDGNYTWFVSCIDEAGNYNLSEYINFSVEAPPNVTLDSPNPGQRLNYTTIDFVYTPYDPIGIQKCDLYIDGVYQANETTVFENEQNFFNNIVVSEGQHNWTVECNDSDVNTYKPTARYFYIDQSGPNIYLILPENNIGVDYNDGTVLFRWNASDALDNILQCDLYVDGGVQEPGIWVTSDIFHTEPVPVGDIGLGYHNWSVTCWDHDYQTNINTSDTWFFNLSYPDFLVNTTGIEFNNSVPREGDSVLINATIYNLGPVDVTGVLVSFFDGDPDSGGIQINGNQTINIEANSSNITSVIWSADIGESEIFVVVDPPLASNGSFDELDETNNKDSKNLTIGSWHFFYGDIDANSQYRLANNNSDKIINWTTGSFNNGSIFIADYEAVISWLNLIAIGRDNNSLPTTNDFDDIDTLLNMNGFADSVNNTYLNGENTTSFLIFGRTISNVPITFSINSSNFTTGILWDEDDDSDGEFSQADIEDLIFVAKINKDKQGAYGFYDYELRVPAKLREYDLTNSETAVFYAEIY